jgi:hypothetical protein
MHLRETNTWQIHATQNQKQQEHNTTQHNKVLPTMVVVLAIMVRK